MTKMYTKIILIAVSLSLFACASHYTIGEDWSTENINTLIQPHTTTKAQVRQQFGSPGRVSKDAQGLEVWTYQQDASVNLAQSRDKFGTVILATGVSSSSYSQQTQVTQILRITFNKDDVVSDVESSTSQF